MPELVTVDEVRAIRESAGSWLRDAQTRRLCDTIEALWSRVAELEAWVDDVPSSMALCPIEHKRHGFRRADLIPRA